MNVKQLKKIIEKLPDTMDVMMIMNAPDDEFPLQMVETVEVKECLFSEESGVKTPGAWCKEKCLVISNDI